MKQSSSERRTPQILLVEDNPAHAELVMRCLEDDGCQADVVHVTDGERALDALTGAAADAWPDLIVLDLQLPKLNGLEVLEHLKNDPDLKVVPIVVFTSSRAPADVRGAYLRHANSYLVKPIDYDAFNDQIRLLRNYWGRLNHPPLAGTG